MAEAAQVQQPSQPEQQQQPVDVKSLPIEERLMRVMEPRQAERPRTEQGRFAPQNPQVQPEPQAEQQTQEQPSGNEQQTAETQPDESDVVNWDEVREVKVKVPLKRGEQTWDEELSLDQLREGYLRTKDYIAKTQEVSAQQKAYEANVQQAVARERQTYIQTLQTLQRTVVDSIDPELRGMTQEKWTQLANDDPAAYVRLQNRAQQVQSTLGSIGAQIQQQQRMQEAQEKHLEYQAIEEAKRKVAEIPDWNENLYQAVLKRGVETYGFTPDEMTRAYDDRFIRMMVDLEKYHKMQEQKPAVEKRMQSVPQVLKPGNVKPKQNAAVEKLRQARERLKTSGTTETVADVFKNMGF